MAESPDLGVRTEKQAAQDEWYSFPYHHLASWETGTSMEYLSYIEYAVEFVLERGGDGPVLDAGCGDGRLTRGLATRGVQIVGTDYSDRALAFARAFEPEVEFVAADLASLPFKDGGFTCIVMLDVLEHIRPELRDRVVSELARCLHPAGTFLLTVPTTNMQVGNTHYEHFTERSLKEALSSRFVLVECRGHLRAGVAGKLLNARLIVAECLSPVRRWLPVLFKWWVGSCRRSLRNQTGHTPCDRSNRLIAVFRRKEASDE